MEKFLLLMLLVPLGVVAAGCGGSGTTAASGPITVTGTTTIANVKTGTLVSCNGGPGARVPLSGQGVAANQDGRSAASSGELQLTHRRDGSVVAVCKG